MRALWTQTEAEYHGEHANLERSWAWPKPAQPSVPVLLGVQGGERAFEAIVAWGDGWLPGASNGPWLKDKLAELRSRWTDAGRTGRPVIWPMEHRVLDSDQLRAQLDLLRELAADQVVLDIPTAGREEILPLRDRYAKVIAS
jgi:alkanesulfonate monooxygenase SsuD/methylene tetrahydromethanopterin reductase-like flavin-dependent oxidoreductase (luciferase family)